VSADGDLALAAIQAESRPGLPAENLAKALELADDAARVGAQLVVLPECFLSGYDLGAEDLERASIELPGVASDALASLARERGIVIVVGLLERSGSQYFNTALIATPETTAMYRKTHLPKLGVDRFCTRGDIPYRPVDTPFGRVGVLICYDFRFPEPARVLALSGAEIIALPTCWPPTAGDYPTFLDRARASENRVVVVAADQCGPSSAGPYLGRSQVVAGDGEVLAEAGDGEERLLVRISGSERAAWRHVAGRPDAAGLLAERRPDLYAPITLSLQEGARP